MEAEYFKDVIRAQLTTTATKPCTFFGTEVSSGKRVFGKGPFPNKESAQVAQKVSQVKNLLLTGINNPEIDLVELVPNGMLDCQFGYRATCDIDEPHWFQVVRDVMPAETTWPPASKTRSSQKAWPEPVKVVDWSIISKYKHVEYNRTYSKSIYKKNPYGANQFVANILVSWVLGAGADLALSNFVVDDTTGGVMQVDNDVWFNNDWWISDTRAASSRSKAYDHFKKYANGQFQIGEFVDHLYKKFNDNKDAIVAITGPENAVTMEKKIIALQTNWETAGKSWSSVKLIDTLEKAVEVESPAPPTKRPREEDGVSDSAKKTKVDGASDSELPEKIPLVRQQAIPPQVEFTPVIERGNKACTSDNDIYIGMSSSVYRKSVDPWGYSVELRKSDLQKAIRRCDFRQAMVAFFSCYNLSRIYKDDTNAKSIRTNMLNRLCVCAVEDIGVADPVLVNWVLTNIDNVLDLLKNGKKPFVKYMDNHVERIISSIIYQMCCSKKTRIQSHLSHAYNNTNAQISINKYGLKWNYKPTCISDPNFIRLFEENHNFAWKQSKHVVPAILYKTWKRLTGNNRNAIVRYVFTALHFSESGLLTFDQINSPNYSIRPIPERYDLKLYYENKIKLKPQPYAYDMHVGGVNKTPEEKKKFRTVGAFITNEDAKFDNKVYKQIYENSNC